MRNITPELLSSVIYGPHTEVHHGNLTIPAESPIYIHPESKIDLTGSVEIGEFCMIGEGTRILTHDHFHEGREPLLVVQERLGVKWKDKVIGRDVWLHGCIVLYQVDSIPDGTVVGAGSVLTKNPESPYGIYAGNPAVRIGER